MGTAHLFRSFHLRKAPVGILLVFLGQLSAAGLLCGQQVVIVRHVATPEQSILRARADAALTLAQAQLVGENALAQRLENMIRQCDVVYKQFATRKQIRNEALQDNFDRMFNRIAFHQQLSAIRDDLQRNAVMKRTRVGDPTEAMNDCLERLSRRSFDLGTIPAAKTELSAEQIDAIYLTDGYNTFSAKTGKTRLEAFKWPFLIQRKEFQEQRQQFEELCDQALKEIDASGSPSPETVTGLLGMVDSINRTLDALPLSDSADIQAVEMRWRKEAKAFTREMFRSLASTSKLDPEKLSKFVFTSSTIGELIQHLNSKGLRFARPCEQDANLYASVFFIIRYVLDEYEKSQGAAPTAAQSEAAQPQPQVPQTKEPRVEGPKRGSARALREKSVDASSPRVTLVPPYPPSYPGAPTDRLSVQYAVIELAKQAGLDYDWDQSFKNTNPVCRKWVTPRISQMPFREAMNSILTPLGLTYTLQGSKVVLSRGR